MDCFRFENMDIWKDAISISDLLFDYADKAEEKRFYKFAEQLRAATMSISNNIAEGSGSFSDKDFAGFLNISRRSVFECKYSTDFFAEKNYGIEDKTSIYLQLVVLSKKITNFRKALKVKSLQGI